MNDEIFLSRTSALHEILTAWISGIQEQTTPELTAWMQQDPTELADNLLHHLTRNGDARMLTTTLSREAR
jgi:hypothetical protein